MLLSDTVGFVRDLPHNLVASFKATLEEAVHADLLLHVLDVGHPHAEQQFETVHKVLEEIGVARSKPEILLLNKIDTEEGEDDFPVLADAAPRRDPASAPRPAPGSTSLQEAVYQAVRGQQVDVTLEADVTNGRLICVHRVATAASTTASSTTARVQTQGDHGQADAGGPVAERAGGGQDGGVAGVTRRTGR